MARIYRGRYSADLDGDFAVFLIGMRINRPWKLREWWPVFSAMRPMLRELEADPDSGLLHAQQALIGGGPALVQYWRSFGHLDRYARDRDRRHLPAWREFNRRVRASGDVGIWHETYIVRAGAYECVYGNMPRIGLAAAGDHVTAGAKGESAARRAGVSEADEPALPAYETPPAERAR